MIERRFTDNQVTHRIPTLLREVTQIVNIRPIHHALRQVQLRITLRHIAAHETGGTLILKKVGQPIRQSLRCASDRRIGM